MIPLSRGPKHAEHTVSLADEAREVFSVRKKAECNKESLLDPLLEDDATDGEQQKTRDAHGFAQQEAQ